jgi:hypothetical protein
MMPSMSNETRPIAQRDRVFLLGRGSCRNPERDSPQWEWLDSLSEVAQLLSEVVVLRPATEIRGELSGRACSQ